MNDTSFECIRDVFRFNRRYPDGKRVANARLHPEDLLFSPCQGERGLHNGRVQTLFLRVGESLSDRMTFPFDVEIIDKRQSADLSLVGHRRSRTTDLQTIASALRNADVAVDIRVETRSIQRFVSPRRSRAQMKSFFCLDRSLYELRCHCYKARSLIASDSYLSITVDNKTQTTPEIRSLIDRSSCVDSEGIVVPSMECHIALSESRSRQQSTHRRTNHRQYRRSNVPEHE